MDKIRNSPIYDVAVAIFVIVLGVFASACLIVGVAVVLARIAEVAT